MKKIGILILGVLILFVFTTSISEVKAGEVKLKNKTTATLLASVGPAIPFGLPVFQGYGQLYNGQYLKAVGFFANAVIGGNLVVAAIYTKKHSKQMAVIGISMVLTGYILSIRDASLSAEKINRKRLDANYNIKSAPPQILIGSYNLRF